jgi:hypothetical protein
MGGCTVKLLAVATLAILALAVGCEEENREEGLDFISTGSMYDVDSAWADQDWNRLYQLSSKPVHEACSAEEFERVYTPPLPPMTGFAEVFGQDTSGLDIDVDGDRVRVVRHSEFFFVREGGEWKVDWARKDTLHGKPLDQLKVYCEAYRGR